MPRFRYVGTQPTTFAPPVGFIQPGDEFDVPDDLAQSYAQHGLIEPVTKSAKAIKQPATAE